MDVEDTFVYIAGLICEPTRARILWNLLDGRAYTATELAAAADISASSASNHLSKLLEAHVVKVEIQGRHRYYSFANSEYAYVVESLANLAGKDSLGALKDQKTLSGVKYCRTCYDHLAGYVSVKFAEALEEKEFIRKNLTDYSVSETGWKWLTELQIFEHEFKNQRRPLTRQCLDWSERRPHLAGQLGAALLEKMLERKWFKKVQFSRELVITDQGSQEMFKLLGIRIK